MLICQILWEFCYTFSLLKRIFSTFLLRKTLVIFVPPSCLSLLVVYEQSKMNRTWMLSPYLQIYLFLDAKSEPKMPCLYYDWSLFACVTRLQGLAFKFGFKLSSEGSVPVIFSAKNRYTAEQLNQSNCKIAHIRWMTMLYWI